MDSDPSKTREKIIAKISAVPGMPTSATRIISMLQDPEVEMTDLVDALEYDPGLTANILRWANSAYFGGRHEITSIRDAVVRLGMKRMNQLVMTSIMAPIAGQAISGYDLAPGALLHHSIAVAIGTAELGRTLNLEVPDYTFTAGLLLDIGKIVLGMFVEVATGPILMAASQDELSFDEAERHVLGIDHAEVGAVLLERWNIPQPIVSIVRWHHQPEDSPDTDTTALDLAHTAEVMSLGCGLGTGIDGLRYRMSEKVTKRLNITPSTSEAVVAKMLNELRKVQSALDPPASST